ncbi:putative serine/threonine protein kinase [Streptomyces bingchenggensis BCW-1]|uniref:Putative serine/threonine protein kinase n=1 Tax=Streptomyces bingchenggensis (strain BCW-1) TaxID=749414 RepID=D7CAF2_STRBB|nr:MULTISPECIES: PQQ-binding-like beta-propeller repeat protein [Streptomyces]ADI06509.1 putative serine/threonine protein kinase [Streptomyces bingchenggensis BCW-1]
MALPLTHDDPQQLGPFRLIARLGGGGMGTVYLGRSPGGRTVALKTMHEQIATQATFRSRFQLEIDAARVMGERYGAEVVDADPFAAVPWLATEYVLGPPLDDTVALCGPLPERSVRALGAALCAALGQLHRSDVVHRDLKPSNILITAFGPKVIDFGIARAIGDQRLTSVGVTAGTPAFMSPEQAMGAEHTSAGDVFALAGVLIFAATGHGPFGSGQPADLLYRVRFAEPDLGGVPAGLLPVLTRCLSKDPAHRPSMAELAGRLNHEEGESAEAEFTDYLPETALAEIGRRATEVWQIQPTRLPAPSGSVDEAPFRPGMSRRKLLTLSGGAVLGAAAAGVGTWAWLTQRGEHADTAGPRPTSTKRPTNVPSQAVWWAKINNTDETFAPTTVGDLILVMNGDGLVGLEAKTGEERWTRKWEIGSSAEKIKIAWQVVSDGEQAYAFIPENVPKEGLSIYSVDLKNGRPRPLVGPIPDLNGAQGAPAQPLIAADGVIYLVARERNGDPSGETGWHEIAADLKSGKELWRQPFKGAYSPDTSRDGIVAKAVGSRLVLTRRIGVLDIVDGIGVRDTRTGRMLWSRDLPRERLDSDSFLDPGQLVADDDRVYFGTGQLYAFRLSGGDKAWAFGEGRDKGDFEKDTRPYGRPAVKDGVVYVAEGTRGLVAVEADSGKLLWETSVGGVPSLLVTPVIGRKYAYVAMDGNARISAVDLHTHKVAWTFRVPGVFDGAFVAHERAGTLVLKSGDFVYAIPFE